MLAYSCYTIFPTCYVLYQKDRDHSLSEQMRKKNQIMLTFDDGPDEEDTIQLLDLLKKNQVHATFFVLASEAQKKEFILKRMKQEGHRIALHGFSHKSAMLMGYWKTKEQLIKGRQILKEMGYEVVYYRPPWGHINLWTLYLTKRLKMQMIFWTVMAKDWESQATVHSILEKLRTQVEPGSIICLHDAGKQSGGAKGAAKKMIAALTFLLPIWKKQGIRLIVPK